MVCDASRGLSLYSTATQNSGVRGWRWAIAPKPDFCVGDTNMLVSFALGDANFSRFYPTRNLKVAFYPTRNPNASQWNIGCVGCQRKIFASGMYISCFLCRFHLRRAPNANPFLCGIWALKSQGNSPFYRIVWPGLMTDH